jgi:hypothetical protein
LVDAKKDNDWHMVVVDGLAADGSVMIRDPVMVRNSVLQDFREGVTVRCCGAIVPIV